MLLVETQSLLINTFSDTIDIVSSTGLKTQYISYGNKWVWPIMILGYGLVTAEVTFRLLYTEKELLVWQEIWSGHPYCFTCCY